MKGLNLDENLNRLILEKKQKTQGGTDGKKDEV